MKRILSTALAVALVLSLTCVSAKASGLQVSLSEQYLFAGNNNEWYTEESYRASPVVADLDGDGSLEVLNAAYTLSVMDAATGTLKWRVNAGKDRSSEYSDSGNINPGQVFSDFKVVDIDGDGKVEIIIAYGNGMISVLDNQGYFKPGWPQKPTTGGLRSLTVDDLNGDGKQEIIVGAGIANPVSVWVYHCDGTLASGWPQLDASQNGSYQSSEEYITRTAWSAGIYGNGITTGDLDGDGLPEIIVPTDTAFIDAYNYDGSLVKASALYGGRAWGKIAMYEDYDEEIACRNEGWGWGLSTDPHALDTRAQTYRSELGHSAAVYTDVDGDGVSEVVVTALMTDRTTYTTKGNNMTQMADTRYMTAFILNQDRSRYVNGALGFDWTTAPNELNSPVRGPLKSSDPESIAGGVFSVPVCADLDGNGYQEILFNSYDGKLHCFALDGKEHGSWPFTLPKTTSSIYEYATPAACVDLNGDGEKEVIIASWTDCETGAGQGGVYGGTGVNGALYVLSSSGELLASTNLHNGYTTWEDRNDPSAGFTNGVMGAPVVQDIDGDGKYEVLLNTTYYALCVYEISVTGGAPAPTPTPTPTPAPTPVSELAYARPQTVTVDGVPIRFQTYALKDANGNETNYVKVRDIASALNGTAAQFDVAWDGAVNLVSRAPYTPNGSEMSTPFSGDRAYDANTAATKVNGTETALEAILLKDDAGNGYTYYKLRDLGAVLGFTVDWNATDGILVFTTYSQNT